MVDELPKMGLAEATGGAAGEPKTGAALVTREELLLLAPNVNADVVVDSAGFGVTVEAAAAPPKLNPEEPVAVAEPKIELPVAEATVELAGGAAPNVPNVGLSAEAAASEPNVGTTLFVD